MFKAISVLVLSSVLINSVPGQLSPSSQLHVVREWKYLNFTWPNEEMMHTAVSRELYIPHNNLIAGINYYNDFFYLTLPRMRDGVPVTLARIPHFTINDTAPLLIPFPSWEMNKLGDCNSLQNVQNVEIDSKGQMWIIDGGRTGTLTSNPNTNCQPKLIIFDIRNNMTTTVYPFPENVAAKNGSFLYDIVVDETDGGYAYISDNSARDPGIIVYSMRENRAWKIRDSRSMLADPIATQFTVDGTTVTARINIAGIALGPKVRSNSGLTTINGEREVYFCPISSTHLYSISTSILRDEANGNKEYRGEIIDVGRKSSQTDGMMMDNHGVLYYGLLGDNSIAKWDTQVPFSSGQKVFARDPTYLQWPNSFAFDDIGNLTVLSNRLQKFIYGKLDLNEANFWLLSANLGGKSYIHEDATYNYHPANEVPHNNNNYNPSQQYPVTGSPPPNRYPDPHAEDNHAHPYNPVYGSSSTDRNQINSYGSPSDHRAHSGTSRNVVGVLTVIISVLSAL